MSQKSFAKVYRDVSVAEEDGRWRILLDGKSAKTSAGALLALPSHALAEAIAEEWRGQGARIEPARMKLTGLAGAALNLSPARREEVVVYVLTFGRSDLLCYRAETPPELARRQAEAWDPLLAWLSSTFGAQLRTGEGIAFVEQPPEALGALETILRQAGDFTLAALQVSAALSGSLVLALALAGGRLDARAVFDAAHVDEMFQAEKWGNDAEAEAGRAQRLAELEAVQRFLRLIGP
jgi:chaperone required for assembly of F1-ATPase